MYNDAGERTYTVTAKGEITSYAYDASGRLTEVSYPLSNDKTMEDLKERISFGLGAKDGHNPHGLDTAMKGLASAQSDAFDPGELKDAVSKLESENKGLEVGIGSGAKKFGQKLSVDSPTADALTQAYGLVNDSRGKRLNLTQWMWTEEYGYDSQGNRTSLANGWGEIPYAYDAANRMLEVGKRRYAYDANGNLISESLGQKEASYSCTPENRLEVAVSEFADPLNGDQDKGNPSFMGKDGKGAREVGYAYDALGRRISRTTGYAPDDVKKSPRDILSERCLPGTGQGSTMDQTQEYLYDGMSFMVIAEMTKTGGGRGDARFNWQSESNTVGYVYANGALVEKHDATGWSRNESILYYTQDILGSTMQVTDERGKVKESYAYDAFGVAYRGSLSDANSVGYNGKRYDAELGLYNYGYRDYEAKVGRWTTEDPIKAGANWYVYCSNNSLMFVDQTGLASLLATQDSGNGTFEWVTINQNTGQQEWHSKRAGDVTPEDVGPDSDALACISLSVGVGPYNYTWTLGQQGYVNSETLFSVIGASIDCSLGKGDVEVSAGFSKFLSLGILLDATQGTLSFGGIAFHIGWGYSTPISITTPLPESDTSCGK